MERITHWNQLRKQWGLPQGPGSFRMIAERLAAYENTGLDPDTIQKMLQALNTMPDVVQAMTKILMED